MLAPSNKSADRAQVLPRCPVCGKAFARRLTGRRKKFCTDACRGEAHRANNFSTLGPCRAVRRNVAKTPCSTGTFSRENRARAPGIRGPRVVIELEIGTAHAWATEVSDGGVVSLVTQLRPPALVEKRSKR